MPKPHDPDWMTRAFCRAAEDRNRWFTDSRRGPMQNYARELCAPCAMHQPCAAYALSFNDLPIGVVIAGVSLGEDTSENSYQRALQRVRAIAEGEAPDEGPPQDVAGVTAGELNESHRGKTLRVGQIGGVIHEARPRIRPTAGHRKYVDMHIVINTPHGLKTIVLSPKTHVVIR
ncbi:WhiB family transcription factor [Gordonia phage DatBoi]|nr:WhiB family transcription factor [Gordonia phage DatBoi]